MITADQYIKETVFSINGHTQRISLQIVSHIVLLMDEHIPIGILAVFSIHGHFYTTWTYSKHMPKYHFLIAH